VGVKGGCVARVSLLIYRLPRGAGFSTSGRPSSPSYRLIGSGDALKNTSRMPGGGVGRQGLPGSDEGRFGPCELLVTAPHRRHRALIFFSVADSEVCHMGIGD